MLSNMYFIEWFASLNNIFKALIIILGVLLLIGTIAYIVHTNKIKEKEEFKDFVEKYYTGTLNYRGGLFK